MSRINTRILRVPGTTSGQIDERPIGSFNAPMEAAGRAMAGLGNLGKEVAVREQMAKDLRNGTSLVNDWKEYEADMQSRLEEASSSEEAAAFRVEIESKRKDMLSRLNDIGNDEYSDEIESQINLGAGKAGIRAETTSRRLLVSETRFEVREAARTLMMEKVLAGDIKGGREEVRRLYEKAAGTAWSKEQVEDQIQSIVSGLGFLEANSDMERGSLKDLAEYGMTPQEVMNIRIKKIASEQRESDALNEYNLSQNVDRTKMAADGMWDGEAVGRGEAKKRLMASVESMSFDTPEQKKDYLRAVDSLFETHSLKSEIIEYSSGNRLVAVPGLTAMLSAVDAKEDQIGSDAADSLRKDIQARISAFENEDYSEDRMLEIEQAKKQNELLGSMELNIRRVLDKTVSEYLKSDDIKGRGQAARDAAINGVLEATGINAGMTADEYPHGAVAYFKIKDMQEALLSPFLEQIPMMTTKEQHVSNLHGSGRSKEAAFQELGGLYVALEDVSDDDGFVRMVEMSNMTGEQWESMPEEDRLALAKEASIFDQLMFQSKAEGKLPPSIEAWFNNAEGSTVGEKVKAGAALFSKYGIDLDELLPNITERSRAQMVAYAKLEGVYDNDKDRLKEAMKSNPDNIEEAMEGAAYASAVQRQAVKKLFERQTKTLPAGDEKVSFLTEALMKRNFSPEKAMELGLQNNEHFMNLFLAAAEPVLRDAPASQIETGAFNVGSGDRTRVNNALNQAIQEYLGNLGGSTYASGTGEESAVSYPVESQLPKKGEEYLSGPLHHAAIDAIKNLPALRLTEIAGSGFSLRQIKEIQKSSSVLPGPEGEFAGSGRTSVLDSARKLWDQVIAGEKTPEDYKKFLKSREFYRNINDDDWAGWTGSKIAGGLRAVSPAANIERIAGTAIFGEVGLPEDLDKYFKENFIIEASDELMSPEDVADLNLYLETTAGIIQSGLQMPTGGPDRYKYLMYPAKNGRKTGADPIEFEIKREHYQRASDVTKAMIETLPTPPQPKQQQGTGFFELWMRG